MLAFAYLTVLQAMQNVSIVNMCNVLAAADSKAIKEKSIGNEVFFMKVLEDYEGLMCDIADSAEGETFLCGLQHELVKGWPKFLLQ